MAMWRGLFSGLVCLGLLGCQDPPQLVTAAPPGTEPPPPLPDSEKEPAEALGEQAKAILEGKDKPAAAAKPKASTVPAPATAPGETKTTAGGVKYETLKEGTGAEAKSGDSLSMHYTGTLEDGKVFDSSREKNQPFGFTLGRGEVIRGWDEGILGMKVGERRKLTIPPELGYGASGFGSIPGNATLTFDVELLGIK